MKKYYLFTIFSFFFAFKNQLYAQNTLDATGGNFIGNGGSVSFSVGQLTYNSISKPEIIQYEGVQHPVELLTIVDTKDTFSNLDFLIFPNPTYDLVTLQIGNTDLKNLSYQLIDILGRKIESNNIDNFKTQIDMSDLPAATYVLEVFSSKKIIKYFKIIKN